MSEQLSLFEEPKVQPNQYRLLLAIFPDAEAIDSIRNHQTSLSKEFGLMGKPRPGDILHVTLHHVADYPEIPHRAIASATEAAASALSGRASFEVVFDHVRSFRLRPQNHAFVLMNPNGNPPLMALHRQLITELAKRRLATARDFQREPHITMLYDKQLLPLHPVSPVRWQVKEVVLFLSHLGATKYERLGSWELNDRS